MNIHLLGLPWLKTHKQYLSQAQMQKIIAFPEMMKGYDYNFIHYGGEGSEIEAELVQVFSENDYHQTFGSNPPRENEQAEDIEQLERDEFCVDIPTKDKILEAGRVSEKEIRELS